MLKAYNQKIIETPTYTEIWEYEKPIVYKVDEKKNEEYEHPTPEWIKNLNEPNKKYDELTAEKQYDSLKRKQKHYKNMRFEIARLIDMNFDDNTKFLTLTFKENIQDIETTNDEFKKYIKRLNYQIYKTKKSQIKYLATWEKQKRGAIHYHIVLFSFPFVPHDRLMEIWGHGLVWINKIDVDAVENRGRYISKYFDKDLDLKEHKKKAFFKSQNLKIPKETKKLTKQEYDTSGQKVLHTKNYIRRSPKFSKVLNEAGAFEQVVEFEESNMKYTKIKKGKNTETH
ncbi:rolling circle replication-associated protein [Enterococcus sp. DIV0175]|uniref:rolling circle replication-associated protein n=1 Tax=Enterococcus sp. DIV0175 TaxID=2774768 RepID=UPI003D3002DD